MRLKAALLAVAALALCAGVLWAVLGSALLAWFAIGFAGASLVLANVQLACACTYGARACCGRWGVDHEALRGKLVEEIAQRTYFLNAATLLYVDPDGAVLTLHQDPKRPVIQNPGPMDLRQFVSRLSPRPYAVQSPGMAETGFRDSVFEALSAAVRRHPSVASAELEHCTPSDTLTTACDQ